MSIRLRVSAGRSALALVGVPGTPLPRMAARSGGPPKRAVSTNDIVRAAR